MWPMVLENQMLHSYVLTIQKKTTTKQGKMHKLIGGLEIKEISESQNCRGWIIQFNHPTK